MQLEVCGRTVVGERGDRDDVTRADRRGVVLDDRRLVRAGVGDVDDGHLRGRGCRTVGDRVGEGHWRTQRPDRAHADELVVHDVELEPGLRRRGHRLHDEHAARGVVVVREHGHQHGLAGREECEVVVGDRRLVATGAVDHVDAHDVLRDGRAVGDGVLDVDGALALGREGERARGRVEEHLRTAAGVAHLGEAELVAVGVGVVVEGADGGLLVDDGDHVVGVGDGSDVVVAAQVDVEGARGDLTPVRDPYLDLVQAGIGPTEVGDGDGAVLAALRRDVVGALDGLEVDRVTVRVDPVLQQVVLHLGATGHDHRGRAVLGLRGTVDRPRVDLDLHLRRGRLAAAVAGGVLERVRARRSGPRHDLEGLAAADREDLADARVVLGRRRQDVPVLVGVVVEHGKGRRTTGTYAVGVGVGLGRVVLLGPVGVELLVLLLGLLLLLLLVLVLPEHVVPVGDERHVVVDQEDVTVVGVVQHDHVAVDPEDGLRRLDEPLDGLELVGAAVVAHPLVVPGAAPGGVGAGPEAYGRGGVAGGRRSVADDPDLAAGQRGE